MKGLWLLHRNRSGFALHPPTQLLLTPLPLLTPRTLEQVLMDIPLSYGSEMHLCVLAVVYGDSHREYLALDDGLFLPLKLLSDSLACEVIQFTCKKR